MVSQHETEDERHQKLRRVVDSLLIVSLSRGMAVLGVPFCAAVGGFLFTTVLYLKEATIEMKTALLVGIEPRIARLEQEQQLARQLRAGDGPNAFGRKDARELEARVQREIDTIRAQIEALRNAPTGRKS